MASEIIQSYEVEFKFGKSVEKFKQLQRQIKDFNNYQRDVNKHHIRMTEMAARASIKANELAQRAKIKADADAAKAHAQLEARETEFVRRERAAQEAAALKEIHRTAEAERKALAAREAEVLKGINRTAEAERKALALRESLERQSRERSIRGIMSNHEREERVRRRNIASVQRQAQAEVAAASRVAEANNAARAREQRERFSEAIGNLSPSSQPNEQSSLYAAQARAESRANDARMRALRAAQQSVRRTLLYTREARSEEERLVQTTLRRAVTTARTAAQVQNAAAAARNQLTTNREILRVQERQSWVMNRMTNSSQQFAGNMIGAFAIAAGARSVVDIGMDIESAGIAMNAAAGNVEEGTKQMAFAREEAVRLGLDIVQTSKQYSQLLAAGEGKISMPDIQNIFKGVSEASVVMGLSSDDTAGTLRAIVQMMSKGKVMAEELRGQLGERMSPAYKLFAQAVGVGTEELDKMLKKGQVFSDVYLPKFAVNLRKFAEVGLDDALESNRKHLDFMKNAFKDSALALFEGMGDGFKNFVSGVQSFLESNRHTFIAIGRVIGSTLSALGHIIEVISPFFVMFGKGLTVITDIMGEFSGLLLLPLAFGFIAKILGMATAFGTLATSAGSAAAAIAGVGTANAGAAVAGTAAAGSLASRGGLIASFGALIARLGVVGLVIGGIVSIGAILKGIFSSDHHARLAKLSSIDKGIGYIPSSGSAALNNLDGVSAGKSSNNGNITVVTQIDGDVVAEKVVGNQRLENAVDSRISHHSG